MLIVIERTFFSEKLECSCLLVISSRRGCRHVPGLSVGAAAVFLTGVEAVLGIADEDMMTRCAVVEERGRWENWFTVYPIESQRRCIAAAAAAVWVSKVANAAGRSGRCRLPKRRG